MCVIYYAALGDDIDDICDDIDYICDDIDDICDDIVYIFDESPMNYRNTIHSNYPTHT